MTMDLAPPPGGITDNSEEGLVRQVQEWAGNHGYAVVTARSKKNLKLGIKRKIWLRCDRGGKVVETCGQKRIHGGSRLNECPFSATAARVVTASQLGDWMLEVVDPEHNHAPTPPIAHPSLRALAMTSEVKERIKAETKSRAKPSEMVDRLRDDQDEEAPLFTSMDIRNAKTSIRRETLGFLSPIQALLRSLQAGDWWIRLLKDANEHVTHLFFSKPSAHLFLKQFWNVILMDCTYKTNRYKMPLLVITGVTNLNTTYYLAFCFLRAEETDDYAWALEQLRELLLHVEVPDPGCIITDRELKCISQIKEVFPQTQHLLCIWHINKNVVAHCKKHFADTESWETFYKQWNEVVYAHTTADFNTKWNSLQDDYPGEVSAYLSTVWVTHWKWRFVKCFTDRHLHFGNRSTSRSEGSHAKLKRALLNSVGDLSTVIEAIDVLLRRERFKWSEDLNARKSKPRISHRAAFLRDVLAEIPPWILEKVLEQHAKIGENMLTCTNSYTKHMGIPCSHQIKARLAIAPGKLQLEDFHPHWRYNKPASYSARYAQSEDDNEAVDTTNIDPLLHIQEPVRGREKGRPRGSTAEPSAKRTRREEEFERSTRRQLSHFERVEDRLRSRAPPTPPPVRTHRGRGGSRAYMGRTATSNSTNTGEATQSPAITASQVARDEEDAEYNAWQARLQQGNGSSPAGSPVRSPAGSLIGQTDSRSDFITTWGRGGLLSLPPRRLGRRGGPSGLRSSS